MVRVHQEKVLRKGRREQVEESFAKLVKLLGLVSVLVRLLWLVLISPNPAYENRQGFFN